MSTQRPHRRGLKARIVALAMVGHKAKDIACLTGCSDVYAYHVLQAWRAGELRA
jgi:hypothetical protein